MASPNASRRASIHPGRPAAPQSPNTPLNTSSTHSLTTNISHVSPETAIVIDIAFTGTQVITTPSPVLTASPSTTQNLSPTLSDISSAAPLLDPADRYLRLHSPVLLPITQQPLHNAVVMVRRDGSGYCKNNQPHQWRTKYPFSALFMGICCFPCGVICCQRWKYRKCRKCGIILSKSYIL